MATLLTICGVYFNTMNVFCMVFNGKDAESITLFGGGGKLTYAPYYIVQYSIYKGARTTTNSRVREPTILKNVITPYECISGILRIVEELMREDFA